MIYLAQDTRKSSARPDGTYPIVIRVPNGKHPVDIQTGISVPPDGWDARSRLCTGKGARHLNNALSTLLAAVQQRALDLKATGRWSSLRTPRAIREALTSDGRPAVVDVVTYMTDLAKSKERRKTQLTYLNTVDKLRKFAGARSLHFDDLTAPWLRSFASWLSDEERLATNSIGIHMRNLRACVNRALDDEITDVYGFRRYSIRYQPTRHRALTAEELRAFLAAPVTPTEEEYRDVFLLGFLLIGINIVDLARLTAVEQGRVHYSRSKTGKLYSIKVEPEAQAIIDRYRGERHLLRHFDTFHNHENFTHHLNKHLKRLGGTEVGKQGKLTYHPLFPDISYYWCRHTWASLASSIGIPEDTIRHALGHGAHRVTDTYIDYDLRHVDEANRAVIDHVLEGGDPLPQDGKE